MSVGKYDPDAPEGARPTSSQYIKKKDIVVIAIVLLCLTLIGVPVYKVLKERSDNTVCRKNFKGMSDAMVLYADNYDQRFPPVYEPGDGLAPTLLPEYDNLPVVWATVIQTYMNDRVGFQCPAAQPLEAVRVNGTTFKKTMWETEATEVHHIDLTYGMTVAASAKPRTDFANPEKTVLLAETSNFGAMDTFNAVPFQSESGLVPYDGFLIGYNDSNSTFSVNTFAVTRLAFYGSAGNRFGQATTRHKETINVLYIDGHIGAITPQDAYVQRQAGNRLTGLWANE